MNTEDDVQPASPADDDETNIHALWRKVREHPDYAFGVLFTRRDFPHDTLPENARALAFCEDRLAELGNEIIEWGIE